MAVLNFRRKPQNELESGGRSRMETDHTDPESVCPNCRKKAALSDIWENLNVCPSCGYHMRTGARQRIDFLTDAGSFEELFENIVSCDPLNFPDYEKKLSAVRSASNEKEAVICGRARIDGQPCAVFVMDPRFMMGSMGSAVGEKITRIFEYAAENKLPVVGYTVSGGARMQEGLYSLMQMAKTSGAVRRHGMQGLLYIAVLTSPTTGGVTASFAMEADITLAEPGATIGFAGARVIEQTTRKSLPKGFQTAESMQEHGFVEAVIPRSRQKKLLGQLLKWHSVRVVERAGRLMERAVSAEADASEVRNPTSEDDASKGRNPTSGEDASEVRNPSSEKGETAVSAYDSVRKARGNDRPTGMDYIKGIFTEFLELHGDRLYADDPAVVGGLARLEGMPVTVIAVEKGHTVKERNYRRCGAPEPEGYRKALRLMKQAEKFGRPVVCFVDTSGAYCGVEAEERGQGRAIAESIMEMTGLSVPVISVLVGEGGSGGALALAVSNRVWMLENAVYSVISPEGCASILWKDAGRADEAAEALKLTAADALKSGFIEEIISEENIGRREFYTALRRRLRDEIGRLCLLPDAAASRYERFRAFGSCKEER